MWKIELWLDHVARLNSQVFVRLALQAEMLQRQSFRVVRLDPHPSAGNKVGE